MTKEARAFLTPVYHLGWDRIKMAWPWPGMIMDDKRVSWWAGLGDQSNGTYVLISGSGNLWVV